MSIPTESTGASAAGKEIRCGEMLIVQLVAQIVGPDRPVAGEHVFDAATTGPAPVELLLVAVDQGAAAWTGNAIIHDARVIIDADATTAAIK